LFDRLWQSLMELNHHLGAAENDGGRLVWGLIFTL
jgi:hypothetical protein